MDKYTITYQIHKEFETYPDDEVFYTKATCEHDAKRLLGENIIPKLSKGDTFKMGICVQT